MENKEIAKIIGKSLKIARVKQNLTATNMKKSLKICLGAYLNYEKGKTLISAVHLYKCSKILKLPIEHFFMDLP